MQKFALISVTDKSGIEKFAELLVKCGYKIISTGGTASVLRKAGIEIVEAGELSGVGELMGGRVKTLSPSIFAGILARRDNLSDIEELQQNNFPLIDVVVCNLYDFRGESENREELIDIGGASLIRAAAKNSRYVLVVTDTNDYQKAAEELSRNDDDLLASLRKEFARKAWNYIADYDRKIADAYDESSKISLHYSLFKELRYGENPHQKALWCISDKIGLHNARIIEGKELSYNNILDLVSAMWLVCDLGGNSSAVIKHQNPCGAAKTDSVSISLGAALLADSSSAYGGIVAVNGTFDETCVPLLKGFFLEVLAARKITDGAIKLLDKRKNLRIVEWSEPDLSEKEIKTIPGGILLQDRDNLTLNRDSIKVVSKRQPTDDEFEDMVIADTVAKHVRSNAVVICKDRCTVGIGAGQMNRSDSVRLAVMKAGERINGAVMSSDGFFPFADGIELAKGVSAVIQPGGSIRDNEVIEAADKLGIALIFTGVRHFRH